MTSNPRWEFDLDTCHSRGVDWIAGVDATQFMRDLIEVIDDRVVGECFTQTTGNVCGKQSVGTPQQE